MSPEYLAASVNDNKRLNDKCDDFAENLPEVLLMSYSHRLT